MAFGGMTPQRIRPGGAGRLGDQQGFAGRREDSPPPRSARCPQGPTDWIFRSRAASEEKGPFVSVTQLLPDRAVPSGSLVRWLSPGGGSPAQPARASEENKAPD